LIIPYIPSKPVIGGFEEDAAGKDKISTGRAAPGGKRVELVFN
jgi:hypothetical protein